jgi:hypothetical protein
MRAVCGLVGSISGGSPPPAGPLAIAAMTAIVTQNKTPAKAIRCPAAGSLGHVAVPVPCGHGVAPA